MNITAVRIKALARIDNYFSVLHPTCEFLGVVEFDMIPGVGFVARAVLETPSRELVGYRVRFRSLTCPITVEEE